MKQKYLFIDRDGTLIVEPEDQQVDSIQKLDFMPGVFSALSLLTQAGYQLVIISNQDGLGTRAFPQEAFDPAQQMMIKLFLSQDIKFEAVRICPHRPLDNCQCRKPKLGLVLDYLIEQKIDMANSYVVGDRDSDMDLAKTLQLTGIQIGTDTMPGWEAIAAWIINKPRFASIQRNTRETAIQVNVNLDNPGLSRVSTGIDFFDHMLEQLLKHSGMSGTILVKGDLAVDAHHSIEDTAIGLGLAIKKALGDKRGISRFGFVVPMDEARAAVTIDLSGRSYCQFQGDFECEMIGGFATEMIPHFFSSFAQGLKATLQVDICGSNAHHMCEAAFKGLGRALGQAMARSDSSIPSTKGVL